MSPAADQAYLRTRLSIMHGRMRGEHDVEALIGLPAAELLGQLNLDNEGHISSERMMDRFERSLMQVWLDEMGSLLRPLHGPSREILVQWARRYELHNLKALIRGKLGKQTDDFIRDSLFRLPGYLSLDHEALLHSDDITELLRRLDHTPYHAIARQAHRRFLEKQDPFLLDAGLDQYFYNELTRRLTPLEKEDREAMRELIGHVVDRHNIVWMMRFRYNYTLSPAEALYLSIDHGYNLRRGRLTRLVEAANEEEFLQGLPKSLRRIIGNTGNIVIIEARLVKNLLQRADRTVRFSPSIVAAVFAYLILRYYELKTLYAIVYARVANLSDDLLRDALHPARMEAPA